MSEGHSVQPPQAHVQVPAAPSHGAAGWLGHAGRAAGLGLGLHSAGALGGAAAGVAGGVGGGLGASLAAAGHHASEAFHARPTLGGHQAPEDHHGEGEHAEGHDGGEEHEDHHAGPHGHDSEHEGPGHKGHDQDHEGDDHEGEAEHEGHEQAAHGHDAHGHEDHEPEHGEEKEAHAAPGAANNSHDTVDHHDVEEAHKSAEAAGAGGDAQGAHEGDANQEESGDAPHNHDQSHASATDYGNNEEQPGENPASLSHGVDESSAAQVSEHLPNIVTRLQKNFGEDFSNVKFSNDVPEGAKAHGAKAVAGPDQVALDPSVNLGTHEGQATLGEELGHVTQMRRNTVQPDAVDQHGAAGMATAGTAAGESRDRAENEAASAGAAAARGERVHIGSGGYVPQNLFFGLGGLWDKAKQGVAGVTNTAKSAGSWVLDKGKQVGSTIGSTVAGAAKSVGGTAVNLYNGLQDNKNAAWDRMNAIQNPLLKMGVKTAAGFVAGKIPGISPLLAETRKDPSEAGRAKFLGNLNPMKWYGAIKKGAEQASDLKKGGLLDRMGFRDIGARFKKIERFVGGKVDSVKKWGLDKLKSGWESTKNFGKSAFNAVKSAPGKLVDKIKGMFPSKGGPPGFFGKLINGAKEKVGGFFGKAKGLATEMFGKATKLGGKALDFMKGMPGKAWDLAKSLPGKAFEGVKGLGGMIKNLLPKGGGSPGLFGKAMAGLKRLGGPVMNTLGKLGGKALPFVQKIGGTLGKLGKAAMPVLEGVGKTLKAVGPGALKVLGPVGKFLGKAGAKIIPGLNLVAAGISTGLSLNAAVNNFKNGNITGGLIDSFNTVTNAAGAIPVIGGVVSIAGDLISGGLHWLTGK